MSITTCNKCGLSYGDSAFEALPLPRKCKTDSESITTHPAGPDPVREPAYRLQWRDCQCRNTLTRILDVYDVRHRAYALPAEGWVP